MINIENSLLDKFKINEIYKDDYIKIYPIYNDEFRFFRNTILYVSNRLKSFFENDINLKKFIRFYSRFIKITNTLPIALSDCAVITEINSDFKLSKISKTLKIAYPDYEKEFDFIIKKFLIQYPAAILIFIKFSIFKLMIIFRGWQWDC